MAVQPPDDPDVGRSLYYMDQIMKYCRQPSLPENRVFVVEMRCLSLLSGVLSEDNSYFSNGYVGPTRLYLFFKRLRRSDPALRFFFNFHAANQDLQ